MDFAAEFRERKCEKGTIVLAWLGQAGFLIKNSSGQVLALDAYLSDLAQIQDGNKRLTQPPVDAEDLTVDVILVSHHHTDHLDFKSIPYWLKNSARLYCCRASYVLCQREGFSMEQIKAMGEGDIIEDGGYRIEAVFSNHGDTAPCALGFLIETEGIRLYFTGDTSYQQERMKYALDKKIDVLLIPINGEYGNMNERDAAMLAAQASPNLTIPCHFWTFARHRGNPWDFLSEMKRIAPQCNVYLMAQGEIMSIP